MSKSAPSDQSRINLLDSKDLIVDKIKRCKTDSFAGLEFDNAERPECNNLLSIYQIVSGKKKEEVMEECKDMSWGTFKPLLADALIEHLSPIQARYQEIIAEPEYLDKILSEGADRAEELGAVTMRNMYQAMGYYQRRRY
jgi:tryptophanyl-tRNA synthetase